MVSDETERSAQMINSPDVAPAAMLLDEYFEEDEMAAELAVSKPTLRRWRAQRKGPPITRVGRKVLYRKSSSRAWIAAQEGRA